MKKRISQSYCKPETEEDWLIVDPLPDTGPPPTFKERLAEIQEQFRQWYRALFIVENENPLPTQSDIAIGEWTALCRKPKDWISIARGITDHPASEQEVESAAQVFSRFLNIEPYNYPEEASVIPALWLFALKLDKQSKEMVYNKG